MDKTDYYGLPAYRLSNEDVSLTVVPALSGRVMQLATPRLENLFWVNTPLLKGKIGGDPAFGGWKNWGGYKTWLAPQSRWPDPNAQSAEMDNAVWQVTHASPTRIDLIGNTISWGGAHLGRSLSIAESRAVVIAHESITNVSQSKQTWSVWAVAQFPVPGWAHFPPNDKRRTLVAAPPAFKGNLIRFDGTAKWKVGALSTDGWGEYRADGWGISFRAEFAPYAFTAHPDECNLEVWSNTAPNYMELEWLSPLVTLAPGEQWAFETRWVLEK